MGAAGATFETGSVSVAACRRVEQACDESVHPVLDCGQVVGRGAAPRLGQIPPRRPASNAGSASSSRPGGLALASRLEVGRPSFQEAAMTLSDVGREAVRLVSQLTGVAISVPVVAGFVLLGAAVLVGGSLLDVGRKLLETKSRAQEPLKAA